MTTGLIERSRNIAATALTLGLLTACGGAATPNATSDAGAACPEPAADSPPDDVFCTGLYENHDVNQRAKSAVAYTPGIKLWSDGAEKQRFFYLPPGTKIDTTDMDAWKYPVGTKAWKEFRVNGVLVETRFLWKRAETGNTAWVHGTYIWDAALKNGSLNTFSDPTILDSGYEIPVARACPKCHGGASDTLLGIEAVSLALPTASGVTVAQLVADGALTAAPSTTSIELPEDATGKAADALGYMHMNCGAPCHSDRGVSGFTQLHTRIKAAQVFPAAGAASATVQEMDVYTSGLNKNVILATYQQAFPNTKLIVPGSHTTSLTWVVAHLRGEHQMPPVASHKIDDVGTKMLADWIDALPK